MIYIKPKTLCWTALQTACTEHLFSIVGYGMFVANLALHASLAIYHHIYNAHLWKNIIVFAF